MDADDICNDPPLNRSVYTAVCPDKIVSYDNFKNFREISLTIEQLTNFKDPLQIKLNVISSSWLSGLDDSLVFWFHERNIEAPLAKFLYQIEFIYN